jgi:hypothetical protein
MQSDYSIDASDSFSLLAAFEPNSPIERHVLKQLLLALHDKRRYIHIFSTDTPTNQFIVSLCHHLPPFERERRHDILLLSDEIDIKENDPNYVMKSCAFDNVLRGGLAQEMVNKKVSCSELCDGPNEPPIWVGKIGNGRNVATIILYHGKDINKEEIMLGVTSSQQKIVEYARHEPEKFGFLISIIDICCLGDDELGAEGMYLLKGGCRYFGIDLVRVCRSLMRKNVERANARDLIVGYQGSVNEIVFRDIFGQKEWMDRVSNESCVIRKKGCHSLDFYEFNTTHKLINTQPNKSLTLFSKHKIKFPYDITIIH